ncbi:DUF2510 domain-containing protein [Mycolicibacterium psychrotolerans]|uniref:DUF2510 domain-containing protein n=1 Tax=Mycolicibacterium psychrotolerans TaxID=216929 RepID=UPI003D67359E
MTCANGHDNPDGQYFCGECGDLLEAGAVICLAGHANPDTRRFCGDCGAPLVAPPGLVPATSTARWSVDPTGRHQCRYWDGVRWTRHVADGGTLGVDRESRRPESWVALIAGLITVALLAGAGADIWVQLSRDATKPSAATTSSTSTTSSTPPTETASSSATPAPAAPRPAAVASPCQPGTGDGVAADGSPTFCERLADTDTYLWSLSPGDIPMPDVGQGGNPAVGVCMAQTGRTEADCLEYLQPAQ